jgi:hypothetical protein
VFKQGWDLRIYLACIEISRAVEHALHTRRSAWWNAPPMALSHFISFVYVCERLGKFPYQPEEVVALINEPPTVEVVARIRDELSAASKRELSNERRTKGVLLSTEFVERYVTEKISRAASSNAD